MGNSQEPELHGLYFMTYVRGPRNMDKNHTVEKFREDTLAAIRQCSQVGEVQVVIKT